MPTDPPDARPSDLPTPDLPASDLRTAGPTADLRASAPVDPGLAASGPTPRRPRRPKRLLLYGMYDVRRLDKAPKVRIWMMAAALSKIGPTDVISDSRIARMRRAAGWVLGGGPRRTSAVYVESSTSTPMPQDYCFLLLMRLLGRPVGVYFRDAYQLYRDMYPLDRRRQRLLDWIWQLTLPVTKGLATHRFVLSRGLGDVLGLRDPILLPPGTEPDAPDLGAGHAPLVAYVGGTGWADGFETLLEAMEIVRAAIPDARLRVVCPPLPAGRAALPEWVDVRQAGRDELPDLLRDARLCAIPRPITEYTNFALPIKLFDYLSFGKPIVMTATTESAEIVRDAGAGIVTDDTAEGLAAGFRALLEDEDRAIACARSARAWACLPTSTWEARARTVVETLVTRPGRTRSGETAR